MDRVALYKRVLRNVLRSPLVGVPIGLGAATWALGTVTGEPMGFLGFLGASGIVMGIGLGLSKLVLFTDQITRNAYQQLLNEQDHSRDSYLNQLGHRLEADNDPRTNRYVAELRQQHDRLVNVDAISDSSHPEILHEIKGNAEKLYQSCLNSLERSLLFWDAAEQMATREARDELLGLREQLLEEIRNSVYHLGKTLDRLHASALRRSRKSDLAQIRKELEMGLEVAQRVEQRMSQIEEGLDVDVGGTRTNREL